MQSKIIIDLLSIISYTKKCSAVAHNRYSDSHYYALEDQSRVHTTSRHKTGTSLLSSARLSNVQRRAGLSGGFLRCRFYRLPSYIPSCFAINVHRARIYAFAGLAERAANLPVNSDDCERTRVRPPDRLH